MLYYFQKVKKYLLSITRRGIQSVYFYAKSVHFLVFVHYQNLHQSKAHMCNILAHSVFDILEINITDEDSN